MAKRRKLENAAVRIVCHA